MRYFLSQFFFAPFLLGALVAVGGGSLIFAQYPREIAHELAPAGFEMVTDADVQVYLDKQAGVAQGRAWRFAFDNAIVHQAEAPIFGGWPEIVADPLMWDWADHVILHGDHKEWRWASELAYLSPITVSSTASTSGGATTIVLPQSSCFNSISTTTIR